MTRATTVDELIDLMEQMQKQYDADGDPRRFFNGTYRRSTIAVRDEIARGGFSDGEWLERWDLVFADLYLDAAEAWDRDRSPSAPWKVAFEADPSLPPLRHVLLGMNAHVNYDLPQALVAIITDEEFDSEAAMARRYGDHKHVDDILTARVAAEDRELAAVELPGQRTLLDRMLQPFNRSGTRRFLKEARLKVFANARALNQAKRHGPDAYASRLAQLEALCGKKVAELRAPGQVILRLTRHGFGVELPPS